VDPVVGRRGHPGPAGRLRLRHGVSEHGVSEHGVSEHGVSEHGLSEPGMSGM